MTYLSGSYLNDISWAYDYNNNYPLFQSSGLLSIPYEPVEKSKERNFKLENCFLLSYIKQDKIYNILFESTPTYRDLDIFVDDDILDNLLPIGKNIEINGKFESINISLQKICYMNIEKSSIYLNNFQNLLGYSGNPNYTD